MDPNEFNNIPKDTMMIIGNMPKFIEFVSYNSINKAIHRIIYHLFEQKPHALKLIEKYVIKHSDSVKEYIKDECVKYVSEVNGLQEESEDMDFSSEPKNEQLPYKVRRGDIDRLVINSSNEILYKVLQDMSKDKLVKLCWDANSSDFLWVIRSPGEKDKVETPYTKIKKRQRKQK